MAIPAHLLPHQVVIVRPATATDAYNNTVLDHDAATRTTVAGWLQQDQRADYFPDGRAPVEQRWLLLTNHADIATGDRVEWAGHPSGAVTFDVHGPPEPAYDAGSYHHTETTLRLLAG